VTSKIAQKYDSDDGSIDSRWAINDSNVFSLLLNMSNYVNSSEINVESFTVYAGYIDVSSLPLGLDCLV
jgi:hypothetical protein